MRIWDTSFVRLSCEIEGHPLGGGMLKLEPREAARVLLPDASLLPRLSGTDVEDSLVTLRTWRHYSTSSWTSPESALSSRYRARG